MNQTHYIKQNNVFNKQHNLNYFIIKIYFKEIICLAHDFTPFDLTINFKRMTKVISTSKLNRQNDLF